MKCVTVIYDDRDPGVGYAASLLSLVLGPSLMVSLYDASSIPEASNLLVIGLGKDSLSRGVGSSCLAKLGGLVRSRNANMPVAVFTVIRDGAEGRGIGQCITEWCTPVKSAEFITEELLPRRNEVIEFALRLIPHARTGVALEPSGVRDEIEAFLSGESTCTLCTGYGGMVRATPVEYHYHDGALFIFSEGGVKFANILRNPRVEVAVYRPYRSMDRIMGVRMAGLAHLVTPGLDRYEEETARRGIDPGKLGFALHLIEVELHSAEFLDGRLPERGYAVRQFYTFPPPTRGHEEPHE